MTITIHIIPHTSQTYRTVGNWKFKKDTLDIFVSYMGNWRYEALVGIHEAIEALLCKHRKITGKQVDRFDMTFERYREKGNKREPGDDKSAPYFNEHQFASKIEKLLSKEFGINWKQYDATVSNL